MQHVWWEAVGGFVDAMNFISGVHVVTTFLIPVSRYDRYDSQLFSDGQELSCRAFLSFPYFLNAHLNRIKVQQESPFSKGKSQLSYNLHTFMTYWPIYLPHHLHVLTTSRTTFIKYQGSTFKLKSYHWKQPNLHLRYLFLYFSCCFRYFLEILPFDLEITLWPTHVKSLSQRTSEILQVQSWPTD